MKKTKKVIMPLLVITIAALFFGFNSQKAEAVANAWENVGSAGFSTGNAAYTNIVFNPSTNEPYVVFENSSQKAQVMKFNGTLWETVGNAGFSQGSVLHTSIVFNPSTYEPYVIYADVFNGYKATVMKFNGTSWENVGAAGFSTSYTTELSIAFNPSTNEPYVAFSDSSSQNTQIAQVMKFNGTSWENVGASDAFSGYSVLNISIAFNPSTNEPYVSYGGGTGINIKKFDGNSWVSLGSSIAGSVEIGIVFNPSTNEPYIAYDFYDGANYEVAVTKFNGSSWENVGAAGFITAAALNLNSSLAFNPSTNEPYLSYRDPANSHRLTVAKFNGTSWVTVGSAGFTPSAVDDTSIAFNPVTREPHVAFMDWANSNKATVMKFNSNEVVEPVASPTGGTYSSTQSVTLSTTTSGATIYYTTNGDTPTSGSTEYTGAITVGVSETIKAIAIKGGMTNSEVMSEAYSIVTAKTVDSFSPSALQQDYSDGLISATGGNPLETSKATFNVPYVLDSSSIDITIPSGTEVTRTGGGNLDLTALSTLDATTEINNSGNGYDAPGVIRFGIPNMNLTFSKPVTVSIPVGSAYNGQALHVYYRNEGSNDWSSQGVSCVVSGGVCTFETSHATYFAAGEKSPGSKDDDKKGSKTERKRYKFYKGLYRNAASKKYYQEVKVIKNTNQALFIQWKNIFIAHKHDTKEALEKLDSKTKETFLKYKKYNGYRNYKIYKDKVT